MTEVAVKPPPAEIKQAENLAPTPPDKPNQLEQKIANLITQDGNPDRILQDIVGNPQAGEKSTKEIHQKNTDQVSIPKSGASSEQTKNSIEQQEQFGQQWRGFSDEVYTSMNAVIRSTDYTTREQLGQNMVRSLGRHRELTSQALANEEYAEEAMRMLFDASRDFSGQEPVGDEVISQVKGNLSLFEEHLHSEKDGKAGESLSELAFKTIMKASSNLGPEDMEWGLEVMYRNYDVIESSFKSDPHNAALMLGASNGRDRILSDYEGYEHIYSDRAEKTLQEFVLGNDPSNIDTDKAVGLINTLFNQSRRESVSNDWQSLLTPILERYGLDSEKTIHAWGSSNRKNMGVEVIRENMDRIEELEKAKPGLAVFLQKEFGIKHFVRYPKEVLIRQYEEFEKNDKPYGIVLAADSDHSDAFYGTEEFWKKLQGDLDGQYYLRIFEAGGLYDVGRSLVKLDRKYGRERKISFAILAGHGEQNNIELGNSLIGSLQQRDLEEPGIRRVGKFFVEHPTVTFLSCSTGAEQGIAQALSETMQAKVIAPRIKTKVGSVETKINSQGIEIIPEFYQDGGFDFSPIEEDILRIYDKGKPTQVRITDNFSQPKAT